MPYQAGQWETAFDGFAAAVAADPEDASARYYRGLTAARLGKGDDAIADLESALKIRPDLAPAALDLGVLHLDAGNYEHADTWLKRAYAVPENRFTAALFLGISSYRRGDDAAAVQYLQSAAKDPRMRPAASYYEGLARLRSGDADAAGPALELARQGLAGSPMADAVDQYAASGGRGPAAASDPGRRWDAYAEAGFAYDTNVVLAPDNSAVKRSRDIGSADSGRFQIGAGASYRVLDNEHATGKLFYDLYNGTNFSQSDFDIMSHRLGFSGATHADRWYQFGLSTFYNAYLREYSGFFQEAYIVPWVAFYQGEISATQVYYRFRWRDYLDDPFQGFRDSVNNGFGIRQSFVLGAVDRTITVGYQFADNDPTSKNGTDFAYHRNQFEIEFGAPVLDWFDFTAGYALLFDDYKHRNSRNNFAFARHDSGHQIVLRAQRPITDYLIGTLDYFGNFNGSNLDPFQYDRSIVSAGVRMLF